MPLEKAVYVQIPSNPPLQATKLYWRSSDLSFLGADQVGRPKTNSPVCLRFGSSDDNWFSILGKGVGGPNSFSGFFGVFNSDIEGVILDTLNVGIQLYNASTNSTSEIVWETLVAGTGWNLLTPPNLNSSCLSPDGLYAYMVFAGPAGGGGAYMVVVAEVFLPTFTRTAFWVFNPPWGGGPYSGGVSVISLGATNSIVALHLLVQAPGTTVSASYTIGRPGGSVLTSWFGSNQYGQDNPVLGVLSPNGRYIAVLYFRAAFLNVWGYRVIDLVAQTDTVDAFWPWLNTDFTGAGGVWWAADSSKWYASYLFGTLGSETGSIDIRSPVTGNLVGGGGPGNIPYLIDQTPSLWVLSNGNTVAMGQTNAQLSAGGNTIFVLDSNMGVIASFVPTQNGGLPWFWVSDDESYVVVLNAQTTSPGFARFWPVKLSLPSLTPLQTGPASAPLENFTASDLFEMMFPPQVAPPVRQKPRDDNLALGSTRQAGIGQGQPSSVQYSRRTGVRGTYS